MPRPYDLGILARGVRSLAALRIVTNDRFGVMKSEREEELERALGGAIVSGTFTPANPGAIVAIGLNWYLRNLPQAPLVVEVPTGPGEYEMDHEHPLVRLFRSPNPDQDPGLFERQWQRDYLATGECFIELDLAGRTPRGLRWLPQSRTRPVLDPANGATMFYRHTLQNGMPRTIPFDEVAHFRWSLGDDWRAVSPLQGVTPERVTDREASQMIGDLLANMGMPSAVISRRPPRPDDVPTKGKFDKKELGDNYDRKFGPGGRGRVLVTDHLIDYKTIAWNPDELALPNVQHVSEERVSACMGLDAVVLSLGAGLEHGTYNNQATAREKAWENGAQPVNLALSRAIQHRLLPLFDDRPGVRVGHDYTRVPALLEDQDAVATRAGKLGSQGFWSVEEVRAATGKAPEFDPTHHRIVPAMQTITDAAGGLLDDEPATARAAANGAPA